MNAVELVTTALVTGAGGAVTAVVADLYRELKHALVPGTRPALADHLAAVEAGAGDREALMREMNTVDLSPELIEAARRVLAAADPAGARAGRYVVDLGGAHVQGLQVGDRNIQHNTFG
ncbi:hypothetical protein [Pilimelia anulata]|uniref:hypothetical protein n=1 Tax=Pilimelia anulata TaxID=53371 RepID=UPI00166C50A2|nr:hypothetical protein [Pilimelia anulata]